jgi:hypothetical protein
MKLLPGDLGQTALRTMETSEPQRIEQAPAFTPFMSFTYSSQEMHTADGRTYVKSKQVRFEDGKLTSEQFEGQLPMSAYTQTVYDTQRLFAAQTTSLLKQFSSLFSLLMNIQSPKK